MILAPETIDAYKDALMHPIENGLDFKPLTELFEKSEQAIAKNLVYEQYLISINKTNNQVPKVIFYIIMDEMYQQKKADDGNFGYCVTLKK